MQELEFGHHTCITWDTEHGVKRLDVKMSLRCASSVSVVSAGVARTSTRTRQPRLFPGYFQKSVTL